MSLRPLHARDGSDLACIDALEPRRVFDGANLLHGDLPPGFFAPPSVGVTAEEVEEFMNEADDPVASAPSTSPYAATDEDMYAFTRAPREDRLLGGALGGARDRFIPDEPMDGQSYADIGWSDSYIYDWKAPEVDRKPAGSPVKSPRKSPDRAPEAETLDLADRPAPDVAAEPADDSGVAGAVAAAHAKPDDQPRKPVWIDAADKPGASKSSLQSPLAKPAAIRLYFLKR